MSTAVLAISQYSPEEIKAFKSVVSGDLSDTEFTVFLTTCKRINLDPFARQVYAIKRGSKLSIEPSIDGFRLIAERSNEYQGQDLPLFCDEKGNWVDVWLKKEPPVAAKVTVHRKGYHPFTAIAKYDNYKQNSPTWTKMPEVMLAKCAEALALRKAFPNDLSGLYTREEMAQADVEDVGYVEIPQQQPKLQENKNVQDLAKTMDCEVVKNTVEFVKELTSKFDKDSVRAVWDTLGKSDKVKYNDMVKEYGMYLQTGTEPAKNPTLDPHGVKFLESIKAMSPFEIQAEIEKIDKEIAHPYATPGAEWYMRAFYYFHREPTLADINPDHEQI